MEVTAKQGTRCPKEGKPREYIGESPETVPDTTYYRRLIAEGSLVEVQSTSSRCKVQRSTLKDKKEPEPGT